ncbi:MAG: hypothetical protein AB1512_09835 [Thermodesulfobacteriota bacterium]
MIPIILVSMPAFIAVMWTNLTQPLFIAIFTLALMYHVEKRHSASAFLIGLTPLVRPEGAIVMLVWISSYLMTHKWKNLCWILIGFGSWLLAAWLITNDFFYSLRAGGYPIALGYRVILWDFFLKFHDDFSGPIWFIAIVVGLVAQGPPKLDLVHSACASIFLFFTFIWTNIVPMPLGTFGWVYVASIAPLAACYSLMGVNTLIDGRMNWPLPRERLLLSCLYGLALVWAGIATLYILRQNPYGSMLLLLSFLGTSATVIWIQSPRMKRRVVQFLVVAITATALGYAIFKSPPYYRHDIDNAVEELAHWWHAESKDPNRRVYCFLWGFYYYANMDPFPNIKAESFIPGKCGDTVIWDSWAMGRWAGIGHKHLEENGYMQIPFSRSIMNVDIRIYKKVCGS